MCSPVSCDRVDGLGDQSIGTILCCTYSTVEKRVCLFVLHFIALYCTLLHYCTLPHYTLQYEFLVNPTGIYIPTIHPISIPPSPGRRIGTLLHLMRAATGPAISIDEERSRSRPRPSEKSEHERGEAGKSPVCQGQEERTGREFLSLASRLHHCRCELCGSTPGLCVREREEKKAGLMAR